jgi:hypothetical protein
MKGEVVLSYLLCILLIVMTGKSPGSSILR